MADFFMDPIRALIQDCHLEIRGEFESSDEDGDVREDYVVLMLGQAGDSREVRLNVMPSSALSFIAKDGGKSFCASITRNYENLMILEHDDVVKGRVKHRDPKHWDTVGTLDKLVGKVNKYKKNKADAEEGEILIPYRGPAT
jgi:hypothetical protein